MCITVDLSWENNPWCMCVNETKCAQMSKNCYIKKESVYDCLKGHFAQDLVCLKENALYSETAKLTTSMCIQVTESLHGGDG